MRYYKDVHTYKASILRKDSVICGKRFPAGSVVLLDSYNSSFGSGCDLYVAVKLPHGYNGNNPILTLYSFSDSLGYWECDIYQNEITRKIWKFYANNGRPGLSKSFMPDGAAANMMKHERRHKSGSGSRENRNSINGSLAYKQVTELAYWANLDSSKSGNASVVAAHIR